MSQIHKSYTYEHWLRLKGPLYRVCIKEHGEALIALLCQCEATKLTECVTKWIKQYIAPAFERRIRGDDTQNIAPPMDQAELSESEAPTTTPRRQVLASATTWEGWRDALALFQFPDLLAKKLCESLIDLCDAKQQENDALAESIAWRMLKRYFYKAQRQLNDPESANRECQHGLLKQAKRRIEQRQSCPVHQDRLIWMAHELLEQVGNGLSQQTTDGKIEFILDFLAEQQAESGSSLDEAMARGVDVEDEPLLQHPELFARHISEFDQEVTPLMHCIECQDCPTKLTPEERDAIHLELSPRELGTLPARQFQANFGYSKKTYRRRLQAAYPKLARCLKDFMNTNQ